MKNIFSSIIFLLILLINTLVLIGQQRQSVERYSKVSVTISDESDLIDIQRMGFDMEGTKLNENSFEIILSENEIMLLRESGYTFEILIDDMAKYYELRNARSESEMNTLQRKMNDKYQNGGFGFGSMGGFYTYNEVIAELDTMQMLYPNLITAKFSIGTTLEGRTIWAAKISDNPNVNENEPELFYNSLIHAREPAGMMSVIYFMYYLLENYGVDPEVNYLVESREMYFVPIINPDGYVYNQQNNPGGGGQWRKNRKDNGNSCFGVDLNRNFGYMWGYNNIGSSPDPCALDYRGTEAFSEFETQAIRDFCNDHNFIIGNNYHAYWNVVFTPWGYNLTQTPDSSIYNQTISLGTQFNHYLNGNFNVPGNYETNGGVGDWMYGEQITKPKIFAYLTEVGNDNDGFWPAPERIFPIAEENLYLNKVLAWAPGVIDNPPFIIEADISPSTYLQQGDSVKISAVESNSQGYTSTVTASIINSENVTVEECELTKIDSINFSRQLIVPNEENIYRLLLKDSGNNIPSNFYYNEDSRFTTAGPIVIDSLLISYNSFFKTYTIRALLKNEGHDFTVRKLRVLISSEDTSITYLSGAVFIDDTLAPQQIALASGQMVARVDTNLFSGVFSFDFTIESNGWLYWRDHFDTIVEVEEEESQPLSFNLEQNYPNPFNPTTTIKYAISERSMVELKVYDILGNEVAVLLNEEQDVGYYEFSFNASNLSSGVYLYQLKAGTYLETKKMMLVK